MLWWRRHWALASVRRWARPVITQGFTPLGLCTRAHTSSASSNERFQLPQPSVSPSLQVSAFRQGFNAIFPLDALAAFYEDEIEAMLCGEGACRCCCLAWLLCSDAGGQAVGGCVPPFAHNTRLCTSHTGTGEAWSVDYLAEVIKFDHGYTAQVGVQLAAAATAAAAAAAAALPLLPLLLLLPPCRCCRCCCCCHCAAAATAPLLLGCREPRLPPCVRELPCIAPASCLLGPAECPAAAAAPPAPPPSAVAAGALPAGGAVGAGCRGSAQVRPSLCH